MPTRRHTEVLREAVKLAGRRVVDIGCGRGGLAGWLARQGADVLGVDVQVEAVARARAAGIAAVAAAADALPLADGTVEVAVVFNSLHHFLDPAAALAEARRVLAPGGVLYVAEPLAEGAYFAFMQPVDDETEVRATALRALAATTGWAARERIDYSHEVVVADLEREIGHWPAVDPSRRPRIEAARDELGARFHRHGRVTDRGHAFVQPMRAVVLQARRP